MKRDHTAAPGQIHRLRLESKVLKTAMLGDPIERIVDVYVPAKHDGRGLPLLVDLVGFTGSGPSHTNWRAFTENLPERLDRLIGGGAMPPVAVAFPDCYTRLGGNQYIDSDAMGRYEDYLIGEIVPFLVEDELKALGGIYSKSGDWASYVVTDGLLITGQNPGSSSSAAATLMKHPALISQ